MPTISWDLCQKQSDALLGEATQLLRDATRLSSDGPTSPGNYLIHAGPALTYIGEAKDLRARLKQQLKIKTSTFYGNYLRLDPASSSSKGLRIDEFAVTQIETRIGRKEVEEFGIVHLPATLNRFQLDKRAQANVLSAGLWHDAQALVDRILQEGESRLFQQAATDWFSAKVPAGGGLYHVEHPRHGVIYVGESSDIHDRIITHGTRTYFSALRRHIGEDILGFTLQVRKGKKRYLSDGEDAEVTRFLKGCRIRTMAIAFGRFELEEFLIRKHHPLLNRKDND